MDVLDLRSDTVTRPTPGMRKAMAEAEVGDDVYGEDPTVNRLQDRVAELLGKECAIWVPTGTMANQIAVGSLVSHGEEIVCERGSHIVNYEGAAAPALWGAQALVIDGPRGIFDAEALRAILRRTTDVHSPLQKAVAMENTHNR
ncbi:MAG TPA: beta-eliminating lyase-related protein, partial [Myxococcales bacterium]|nr:beta-eliminating lyase-related protein [Myxococcales bacterium]